MYSGFYNAALRRMDPERAHRLALTALAGAAKTPGGMASLGKLAAPHDERLRQYIWGLPFANPLGVAAGFDKDGDAVEGLVALGFGHVEVGTVTLRPQPGNPKPRIWRVTERNAIINAMGFPSGGAADVRARLLTLTPTGVVGINIGKNRETPLERAAEDYAAVLTALFDVAHYVTINVSSPNTPGLRSLQLAGEVEHLLEVIGAANTQAAEFGRRDPLPLLLKIAPDLTDDELEHVVDAALAAGVNGIVATNTTVARDGIPTTFSSRPGGLSGPPLRARANDVARLVYRQTRGSVPLIGVGGISTAADALARMRAGAQLVQLYTAFTTAGPGLAGDIVRGISADADREGWTSLADIIGSDAN